MAKRIVLAAIVTSFVIQFFILYSQGVKQSVDTPFYLENAEIIRQSGLPDGRALWYSGYSLFLSVIFSVGGSLHTAAFVQLTFSALAAWSLFITGSNLTGNSITGVVASLLYLAWPPIHEWNNFIYTESLFTSCCIFSLTALFMSKKWWHYLLSLALFSFTFSIRPTGFILFSGLVGFCIGLIPRRKLILLVPGVVAFLILTWIVGSTMFQSYDQIHVYVNAEIIYPNETLGVQPPNDLVIPSEGDPLARTFLFAALNPLYFLKLFIIKVSLFYGNMKPYYSMLHNIVIALFLYPVYALTFIGYFKFQGDRSRKFFLAFFILASGGIVGFTTENWDGRFLVPVLPCIFLLAATGATYVLSRFLKTNSVR